MTASQAAETVDKLVELKEKKKTLNEDMDAMIETLESKLITYSKESGHNSVFGKDYKASFKESETLKAPSQKDLRRYALESTLEEMGLMESFQQKSISWSRLKSKLKSDDLTSEQKEKILENMDVDKSTRFTLKKL